MMRIYFIGFMGSGKSHWGRLLSANLGLPFFDLDQVIVERDGRTIAEIFADNGEEYFRLLEKEILTELTTTHPEMILSCGGGTPCFFNNIDYMKEHGRVIWLNTSTTVLVQRLLKEKNHRPLLKDIPDDEMKAFIVKKLHDRKLYYEQAHLRLPEETLSLEDMKNALTA
ncbi:shikimate kinase [Flavihumibacter petaseus]|nr:shikimate kinase [Flavihumibacter petaseus]